MKRVDVAVQAEPPSASQHSPDQPPVPEVFPSFIPAPDAGRRAQGERDLEPTGESLRLEPEEWPTPEEADVLERLQLMMRAPRDQQRPAACVILYQQREAAAALWAPPLDPADWPTPMEAMLSPLERPTAPNTSPSLARLVAPSSGPFTAADSPDGLRRRLEDSGIHCSEDSYNVCSEDGLEEDPQEAEVGESDGDGGCNQ